MLQFFTVFTEDIGIISTSPLYLAVILSSQFVARVHFLGAVDDLESLVGGGLWGGRGSPGVSQVTRHQSVSVTRCSVVLSCCHTHPSNMRPKEQPQQQLQQQQQQQKLRSHFSSSRDRLLGSRLGFVVFVGRARVHFCAKVLRWLREI